jgi:demethylspheroidene O-methyltransferase
MSRVPLSWLERWYGMRDRLLASPSFHAFAARSWLTRRIARQRARTIFDLCAGFVYSQILFACVEINLFETLRGGPLTLEALQQKLDLPHEGARRLVFAAVSLGLLQKRGRDAEGRDLFGLGQHGAALLGNAGALAMVRHHRLLYADLADPVALLRGRPEQTNLERYWAYARNPEKAEIPAGAVADYSELMAASQPLVSTDILDAYDFSRHRCLLDIGGGEGGFLVAAARRVPHLKLQLFDRCRARAGEAGRSWPRGARRSFWRGFCR